MDRLLLKDIQPTLKTPVVSLDKLMLAGDAEFTQSGIYVKSCGGVKTELFKNNSAAVAVDIKCKSQKPLTVRIGYTKSNGDTTFEGIHPMTYNPEPDGTVELKKTFDAANLIVYYDATAFFVQIDCAEQNTFEITDGLIWQRNDLELSDIYSDNLEGMMLRIEDKFDKEALASSNNIENIMVSPSGKKFILNVDDDGNLYTTPTVPKNVLFVGNSLLLGMETYGMCSSSPKDDYYYYVTEAIKEKNPDAMFKKVHGARFEQIEDPNDFDAVWNDEPNRYTQRPMKESFTPDLDLIIIQLGTNVNNEQRQYTIGKTIDKFISNIKSSCPKARIIWIHGWDNEQISGKIIRDACVRWRIGHFCIKDLSTKENYAQLGQEYELPDGSRGIVSEYWISHPGNGGMKKIADRIIDFLKL